MPDRMFMQVRRYKMARTSPYRCEGRNNQGNRCMSPGNRIIDGRRYCGWHMFPHDDYEAAIAALPVKHSATEIP
jgi:hypothetical protein